MEGIQNIQYRVVDGTYYAVMHWKVSEGIVYVKEPDGWLPTKIPVEFVEDFKTPTDLVRPKGESENET